MLCELKIERFAEKRIGRRHLVTPGALRRHRLLFACGSRPGSGFSVLSAAEKPGEETAAGFSSEFAKKTLLNISFAAEKASDTIQYNVNIESFTVAAADLFYRAVRQNSGN